MPSTVPAIEKNLTTSQTVRIRGQKSAFLYPDERLTPQDTVKLTNMNFTEEQTLRKRFGYNEWHSDVTGDGNGITGLAQVEFKAGTRQVELAGAAVYANDGTTRKDITGTAQTDNDDARVRFAFMQDKLLGTNGTNQVWVWGGDFATPTVVADLSGVPFTKCEDLVVHRNLLVALNTTEGGVNQPTRVRWCDVNTEFFTVDVTSWPENNRTEIYHDSAAIVGGCDFNGNLLIFKTDGMYPTQVFVNVGYLELRILETNVKRGFNPIAKNSIISHPLFAFFVARDGAYVVGPDLVPKNISLPIQDEWFNDLNQSRLKYAVSYVRQRDKQVRTLLAASTTSHGFDRMMVWDWDTNDVWIDELPQAMNFGDSWILSDVEYDMLGSLDSYTHKGNDKDQSSDNGTNILWSAKTAPNDLGLPGKVKNIIKVDTIYRPRPGQQNIAFSLVRDQGRDLPVTATLNIVISQKWNTGLKWNDGVTYPGGTEAVVTTFINRNAKQVQVQYSGDVDIEIIGYRVHFELTEN